MSQVQNPGFTDQRDMLLPYYDGSTYAVNAASPFCSTGNKPTVYRFYLDAPFTVVSLNLSVGTAVAATVISAAIYSNDGLTKLIDWGVNAIDSTTTGDKRVSLVSGVTLQPGLYLFAICCTTTTVLCPATKVVTVGTQLPTNFASLAKARAFSSATSMVAGAMPATVTFSSLDTGNHGIAWLEPI